MIESNKKNVGLRRATAERLLGEVLERAEAINADPHLAYVVAGLWVFGSYRDPSRERLGDLDLIVELRPAPGFEERYEAARERSPWGGVSELWWPEEEVWRRLKARSRALSLHSRSQHDPVEFKAELIYEYEIDSLEARGAVADE